MPNDVYFGKPLEEAVNQGTVSMAVIDDKYGFMSDFIFAV
jgi:hypothetical protein